MKGKGIQIIDDTNDGTVGDLKIEVVRDSNGKIEQGIVVGLTTEQNIALILMSHQGEFKFNPEIGVGIDDLILSKDYLEFRHKITDQLKKDGLTIQQLELYENKPFVLKAQYEDNSK